MLQYAVLVLLCFALSPNDCQAEKKIPEACDPAQLPLFQYEACEKGSVGSGPDCACRHHDCRLAYMRQFLPPPAELSQLQRSRPCRLAFARRLQAHVLSNSAKGRALGYPIDVDCSRLGDGVEMAIEQRLPHVCTRSLGKFLRFSSVHVFYEYIAALTDDPTASTAELFMLRDIYYPPTWRPVEKASSCNFTDSGDNGWNCIFQSTLSMPAVQRADKSLVPDSVVERAFSLLIDSARCKDDVRLALLYGLLLGAISQPSGQVQAFTDRHLVRTDRSSRDSHTARGAGTEAASRGLTVSMHVRQGDACDYFVLQEAEYYKTSYLNGPWFSRPCYSVDMYMDKLRELNAKYGVSTVFLATDSAEMIARAKMERGFAWEYLDFPRDVFAYQEGWWVDFYSKESLEPVSLSAAADLNLLKQGDVFLGAFTSHFSKLVFFSMAGHQLTIPPFISLDYPLGCETVDACTTADIEKRETTIERMIVRSPECLRESDHGFVAEGFDHCGLYRAGWQSRATDRGRWRPRP